MQVVENLQRADLHPLDEAAAYGELITPTSTTSPASPPHRPLGRLRLRPGEAAQAREGPAPALPRRPLHPGPRRAARPPEPEGPGARAPAGPVPVRGLAVRPDEDAEGATSAPAGRSSHAACASCRHGSTATSASTRASPIRCCSPRRQRRWKRLRRTARRSSHHEGELHSRGGARGPHVVRGLAARRRAQVEAVRALGHGFRGSRSRPRRGLQGLRREGSARSTGRRRSARNEHARRRPKRGARPASKAEADDPMSSGRRCRSAIAGVASSGRRRCRLRSRRSPGP